MPLDGDFDVDPEHSGEDRGGTSVARVNSAVERSCLGLDPDLVEALADPAVPERASWLASWEQPGDVLWGADLGLTAAGRDELADQAGEWCGEDDRRGAERDRDGFAVDGDVVDRELADGGDLLCVENQQQSRDAVGGRQGVVVEEAAGPSVSRCR